MARNMHPPSFSVPMRVDHIDCVGALTIDTLRGLADAMPCQRRVNAALGWCWRSLHLMMFVVRQALAKCGTVGQRSDSRVAANIGRVAEPESRVIAGAGAVLLDWGATWVDPEPIKARLVNVFTLPEHRPYGLARRLASETLRALRDRGIRTVTLASPDLAGGLYTSLEFETRPGEFRILLS
jgi:GNAT superfamily N-acetyltransferase